MVTQRDLAVATWVTRKSLIASVGETVTVLSLCLDPINMNSVLVIFRVSLFVESGVSLLASREHFPSLFRSN